MQSPSAILKGRYLCSVHSESNAYRFRVWFITQTSKMDSFKEQRVCIKFCYNLGKTASETHAMLQKAFGQESMKRTSCFEWFSRFKSGQTSVEDECRTGRPVTSTSEKMIKRVYETMENDRRQTVRDISLETGISFGSCHHILTETLGMRRLSAKFVPRILTADQKLVRVQASQELLHCLRRDKDFLSKIITGDESWIFGYDPETKQQSSQWKNPGSPRPKKARQVKSQIKSMLIVFYDMRGIIHREFVPQGQTVNQDYYICVLRRLREDIRRKRPEMWESGDWYLQHDNAPPHVAGRVREYLVVNHMNVLTHPPYSPDLAPCDFFFISEVEISVERSEV